MTDPMAGEWGCMSGHFLSPLERTKFRKDPEFQAGGKEVVENNSWDPF